MPFEQRHESGEVDAPDFRSDGIALSPDGKTLYYNSVINREIWSVPTDKGRIYSTDFEDGSIRRTDPATGKVDVVLQDERLIWPDGLAFLGTDLYIMVNQLARQANYHHGKDQRKPRYTLFKFRVKD